MLPLLLVSALVPASLNADTAAMPTIVTSIKPLAIIAKSAVGDAAKVSYLLPTNQSPHDFSLPVSALKRIASSDLVIWIGRDFETRSAKTLAKVPSSKLITAMDQITKQPIGAMYANADSDSISLSADPHVWLDPSYANAIAAEIQTRLSLPISKIITQDEIQAIKDSMLSSEQKTYLSHHDAYGHFSRAFALPAGVPIRDSRGDVRGVKSQYQLRNTIAKASISCVFVEPQYQGKDAAVIAAEFDLPLIALDPQGLSQPLNNRAYQEFMAGLALQFKACFQ